MKPELQRVLIAQACGWKEIFIAGNNAPEGFKPGTTIPFKFSVPDYLSDLNAMHEAEKTLDDKKQQCVAYVAELERVLCAASEPGTMPSRFGILHATAAKRAEAFLRALGKWEDDK